MRRNNISWIRHSRIWMLHIVHWACFSNTTVAPHILGYDSSTVHFVHSTILQRFQLISYEHLHTGYVSSINKAQTVTTDRLRREYLTGEMKSDRRTDSKPPPPKFPWRSDKRDDDRGTSTFNTYRERRLSLQTCVRLLRGSSCNY
jgi:hypothetical protein